MNFDAERKRLLGEKRAAEERVAALLQQAKAARNKAKAIDRQIGVKHENWHCRSLAAYDREHGYGGEMALARAHLRGLSLEDYYDALKNERVALGPKARTIDLEVAAVKRNDADFTKLERERLLKRDKAAYELEHAAWFEFDRKNPNVGGWRSKPPTSLQQRMIDLLVDLFDLAKPTKLTRGEAYDFISANGGNPRFRDDHGEEDGNDLFD